MQIKDHVVDQHPHPIPKVLRRVLQLEEEAERGRAELATQLEKAAQGDSRARTAAENALSTETLRLHLSCQEVRPLSCFPCFPPGSLPHPFILNEEFLLQSVSVSFSSAATDEKERALSVCL